MIRAVKGSHLQSQVFGALTKSWDSFILQFTPAPVMLCHLITRLVLDLFGTGLPPAPFAPFILQQ